MDIGDIVSVVTISGEYVGSVVSSTESSVVLKNPRMILQTQDGSMGFAKGIAVTGEENPTEVEIRSIVFVTPSNDKIQDAWKQATGAILTPSSQIVT